MLVSEFDYHLPPELIAQEPLPDRAGSRMLQFDRRTGGLRDLVFRDLPQLLRPDDLLVFNNTRVFSARLFGRRSGIHAQKVSPRNPAAPQFLKGKVEVLLTAPVANPSQLEWQALVRPGRKIGVGERLSFGESGELEAEVVARGEFGERTLRFIQVAGSPGSQEATPAFFQVVEKIGHIPLPPYINRDDRPADRERYQTVYAREQGSVAAPTAGLHFTPEILAAIRARGIETAEVTLHVGLGTFQPIHTERVEDHHIHSETCHISPETASAINRALAARRRVVAVGTTTVRTLEHAAAHSADGTILPGTRPADLFIYPGHQFQVVGALLTNFHLPKSTLLMMVCAFAGKDQVLAAYRHAVDQRYRFYSYGDCMFLD